MPSLGRSAQERIRFEKLLPASLPAPCVVYIVSTSYEEKEQ